MLKGNAFRVLLPALERIGAKLLLPQVVIDEVVNGFRERLEQCVSRAGALEEEARRIGLEASFAVQLPDIGGAVAKFRSYLASTLNAELLPIPAISHEDLLKRALERRKPFNEHGAGYRDTLIWQTVVNVLAKNSEVCFITANRRDFWEADALHPHLAADLAQRHIPTKRLHSLR